jgi:uncharacterized protein
MIRAAFCRLFIEVNCSTAGFMIRQEGAMSVPVSKMAMDDQKLLLHFARQALERAVQGFPNLELDLSSLPDSFTNEGATFVTLTKDGELRGCIGTLEAYQPLVVDVCEHAVAAGLKDYRFPPVQPDELSTIKIEISRLTNPVALDYKNPQDLLAKLRPGIDGVILKDGWKRATFLPQVWIKIPDPPDFLDHLCMKMGASPDIWRRKKVEVFIYEVEEIHE